MVVHTYIYTYIRKQACLYLDLLQARLKYIVEQDLKTRLSGARLENIVVFPLPYECMYVCIYMYVCMYVCINILR